MSDLYAQFDAMIEEGNRKGHFEKALHGKDELTGLADVYMTTIGDFTKLKREEFGKSAIKLQELIPKMQLDIYNTCVAVVIGTKEYEFWPPEENLQDIRDLNNEPLTFTVEFIQKKHLLAQKYKEDVEEVQLSLMKMQNGILNFQTNIDLLETLNATLGQFDPSEKDLQERNMKIIEQLSTVNLSELTKDLKKCLMNLSEALSKGTSGQVFECIKSDMEARWTFLKALTYILYVAEAIYDKPNQKAREVIMTHYVTLEGVERDLLMSYYDKERAGANFGVGTAQLKGPDVPGPMEKDFLTRMLGAIKAHIVAMQGLPKHTQMADNLYPDEEKSKEALRKSGSKAVKEIVSGTPKEPGRVGKAIRKLRATLDKVPKPKLTFE